MWVGRQFAFGAAESVGAIAFPFFSDRHPCGRNASVAEIKACENCPPTLATRARLQSRANRDSADRQTNSVALGVAARHSIGESEQRGIWPNFERRQRRILIPLGDVTCEGRKVLRRTYVASEKTIISACQRPSPMNSGAAFRPMPEKVHPCGESPRQLSSQSNS
jgi:hypothetical protein